mgnify:CR=1 FL=1
MLQLPQMFFGKKVEIIVLEIDEPEQKEILITETQKEDELNDFQKFLMTAPTWSDTEYENFTENRKLFNQWTIK